jgi:hypothetical protein
VDRTFFATYSREDIENISASVDPRHSIVMWAMPGSPGKLWCYNWVLGRWSTIETSLSGIFTGFTANTSLEGLDALYPSGIDSIPLSLDDPSFAGGSPLLLIANAAWEVGTLGGAKLEAYVETAWIEPAQGRRARVRSLRPITDATDAEIDLDARARVGDAENSVSAASMRANGEMPVRANGRFFRAEVTIPAGSSWSYLQGLEMIGEPGSMR